MHISFLDYLICPKSGENLELSSVERNGDIVITGKLRSSKHEYPIVGGVPRFVTTAGNYAQSFGFEWKKWSRVQFESENKAGPMRGHTRRMFEKIWGFSDLDFESKIFLDVGCGAGRFIDIVRMNKGRIIGIDYSSAVEVAAKNFQFDENVLICQADALNLPIRRESMDGAFSIGVLHHTPKPEAGFAEMAATVKKDGKIALSVYGKGGYYDSPRLTVWRNAFKIARPILGNLPPLLYAYFCGYVVYHLSFVPLVGHFLRLVFPMTRIPDLKWRILDTFDSVSPSYQSAHESFEVFSWFKNAGLINIEPSDWGFTSYHAQK
jgi:SAM-dependent methyltransferase